MEIQRHSWGCVGELAIARWRDRVAASEMTQGSADRYGRVFQAFVRYATARGVAGCDDVVSSVCSDFIDASLSGRRSPSASTQRFRLTVVREVYRGLCSVGLATADPTAGLRVEWRVGRPVVCPLTPLEAGRLRIAGCARPTDTLGPAVVTVALVGGSHRELSEAVVADVDLPEARLRLGQASSQRWVTLDDAALVALRFRVAAQQAGWRRDHRRWDPAVVPLAMHRPVGSYPVASVAPTVSMNLSRALHRAGITRAGVRPRSVREYAANHTYALTERVEDVARFLGLTSLDTAAGFVDVAWQDRWGADLRAGADG